VNFETTLRGVAGTKQLDYISLSPFYAVAAAPF
jgi:hypothetical protein